VSDRRHPFQPSPTSKTCCSTCLEHHKDVEPYALVGTWPIESPDAYKKVMMWFERDPFVQVLVFENVALDSEGLGNLIFVPWWPDDGEITIEVGSRLPDNWAPTGIGWKHLLKEIVTDPELFHEEEAPDAQV
jgi:hypothetical protein